MDLWIRSQDRQSLTKVSNVQYSYKEGSLYTDVNGKHYIGTYYDNLKILGTYATKKRALEVLDEIQRKIEKLYTLENCSLEKNSCIEKSLVMDNFNVYQMPEE